MSLFQEYETLKAANQLITSGSIWEDYAGEVKILYTTIDMVYYTSIPSGRESYYSRGIFTNHFHRVG